MSTLLKPCAPNSMQIKFHTCMCKHQQDYVLVQFCFALHKARSSIDMLLASATVAEILEYAQWLGMDLENEKVGVV